MAGDDGALDFAGLDFFAAFFAFFAIVASLGWRCENLLQHCPRFRGRGQDLGWTACGPDRFLAQSLKWHPGVIEPMGGFLRNEH